MSYIYRTKGTCATAIEVELDGDKIKKVRFSGGCNGNLQGISRMVEGMSVAEVNQKLAGIRCGYKNTSCPDQLAQAVLEAYDKSRG